MKTAIGNAKGADTTLPKITEREFSRQVEQLARLCGWNFYHSFLSVRSPAGFPDLVLVRREMEGRAPGRKRGRVVFVELKSDSGKVTVAQQRWLELLEQAGAEVYLFRPSDWKRMEEVLR